MNITLIYPTDSKPEELRGEGQDHTWEPGCKNRSLSNSDPGNVANCSADSE